MAPPSRLLVCRRSSHVGGVVNLRIDLPTFKLDQSSQYDYATGTTSSASSVYVAPISLNVGLSFQ